ncbi:oviductal glycoprotein 1 [Rhinolophus ferrumequinum]|uniref:Oviductal glycoprotein 1 n=1 Tax=Rhinolophus ferrumequinum TaxID=59479 RepID=A0A7J7SYG3_RHIFE|nr:oviductal glycoprotein 1 [Rhinolophus ferrumequinum]
MNVSRTSPDRLTGDQGIDHGFGNLFPEREAVATETQRKTENKTTIPRGGIVSPARETVSFGKHIVVLEGNTETPGEKTITPVGHQSVTPGEVTTTSVPLQTETSGGKTMVPRRKATAPEKMTYLLWKDDSHP